MKVEGEVGLCAPIVFGSIPFDAALPGRLILPKFGLLDHGDGRIVQFSCTSGKGFEPVPWRGTASRELPDMPPVEAASVKGDYRWWMSCAETILELIESGKLQKLVLAREVELTTAAPWTAGILFLKLATRYPDSYSYCIRLSGSEWFVGSIPELLVSRFGSRACSRPLAGTVPINGDGAGFQVSIEHLLSSQKLRREHSVTVDAIFRRMARLAREVTSSGPSALALETVAHLVSSIDCQLAGDPPNVLDLVSYLHPTPAVGGIPAELAGAVIKRLEVSPRREYAGPVGWMDRNGDGEWTLGLRSAHIKGTKVAVRAGAGFVAGSDAGEEWEEVEAKLKAIPAVVAPEE
ncbi:isochorismate synthase [Streptomyces virginiae]|uniref:isochorismate synthase n=1 Tax=Streptomyces virginiae TaxID=1961 RepID=UPI00225B449A|nr:isochorismate synthase [Streptomyces virginiae]MCX5174694.1 isochorismate synthase [Streptomyces virginiae]